MQLHTLRAILPDVNKHIYIFKSNRLFKNEYSPREQTTHVKYYSYILSQIERNSFYQSDNERLYILKMESEGFESIGLVAKLNIEEIKNILHLHEETINTKVQDYINDLSQHNILTSPLTLSHNGSSAIDEYLSNEIEKSHHLEIKNTTTTYKIWETKNNQEVKDLFAKEITHLFLADGHHRLEALKQSGKNFLYAYIISNKYLKSRNIFRVYEDIDKNKIEKIIKILLKDYDLKKCSKDNRDINNNINIKNLADSDSPALIYNNEIFHFNNDRQNLKASLAQIYKYLSNDTLNFINYHDAQDPQNVYKMLCLFIPKIDANNFVTEESVKFPPHSSYFEPKVPDGLLSMLL